MNKDKFTCPRCGELFTFDELFDNNSDTFTTLMDDRMTDKVAEQVKFEIDSQKKLNKAEYDTKLLKQQSSMKETHQKEIDELNKQISKLQVANAKNKAIQSKTKGDNFENDIQEELNKVFGNADDEIIRPTTGKMIPDIIQIVQDNNKTPMGAIIYELKDADWKKEWLQKLNSEIIELKGNYGILVTNKFQEKWKGITFIQSSEYENIWITDAYSFIFVAQIVRKLIRLEYLYNQKEQSLLNQNYDIYKEQIMNLQSYLTDKLPLIIQSFNKQKDTIESIAKSLESNSTKLAKAIKVLTNEFVKVVEKDLPDMID